VSAKQFQFPLSVSTCIRSLSDTAYTSPVRIDLHDDDFGFGPTRVVGSLALPLAALAKWKHQEVNRVWDLKTAPEHGGQRCGEINLSFTWR
jgi:hypothetical protein